MNWSTSTTNNYEKEAHGIATYKYKDKLLFTANSKDIDKENAKYTITFNNEGTKAQHFFTSKDIFFKWEMDKDEPHGVHLEIKWPNGETDRVFYTPTEIKWQTA